MDFCVLWTMGYGGQWAGQIEFIAAVRGPDLGVGGAVVVSQDLGSSPLHTCLAQGFSLRQAQPLSPVVKPRRESRPAGLESRVLRLLACQVPLREDRGLCSNPSVVCLSTDSRAQGKDKLTVYS